MTNHLRIRCRPQISSTRRCPSEKVRPVRQSMVSPAIETAPDAGRILVISLAGIGDTLIATPFIHELRANFPDAAIDAFVLWAGSKDLLEGNPHLSAPSLMRFF